MGMALIYIVEDDRNIREIEEYALKSNGYEVRCFDEAGAFDRGMDDMLPDLVLLDIMLPGESGLSVLGRIRNNPTAGTCLSSWSRLRPRRSIR